VFCTSQEIISEMTWSVPYVLSEMINPSHSSTTDNSHHVDSESFIKSAPQPYKAGLNARTSCLSTKSSSDFNEIWYVGRGRCHMT